MTVAGRNVAKADAAMRSDVFRDIIRGVPPYNAVIERAAHRGEESITATDVAAHWHEHFKADVANNDKVLNDQAVCFFQLVEGAALGTLIIGRKGAPTRIDFDQSAQSAFVGNPGKNAPDASLPAPTRPDPGTEQPRAFDTKSPGPAQYNRVFITHGKNAKIVQQIKEIVQYGKFEPVVAEEHETVSKPVPEKVMDDMRSCSAGVIHVAAEKTLVDEDGKLCPKINENVLIEIGAAMALYGRRFILLVERNLQLPSNLQGLYQCRYEGDKLDGEATMKLLKAFNEFH